MIINTKLQMIGDQMAIKMAVDRLDFCAKQHTIGPALPMNTELAEAMRDSYRNPGFGGEAFRRRQPNT
jgi:hypothetical protein